jgi:hypothetical protein
MSRVDVNSLVVATAITSTHVSESTTTAARLRAVAAITAVGLTSIIFSIPLVATGIAALIAATIAVTAVNGSDEAVVVTPSASAPAQLLPTPNSLTEIQAALIIEDTTSSSAAAAVVAVAIYNNTVSADTGLGFDSSEWGGEGGGGEGGDTRSLDFGISEFRRSGGRGGGGGGGGSGIGGGGNGNDGGGSRSRSRNSIARYRSPSTGGGGGGGGGSR